MGDLAGLDIPGLDGPVSRAGDEALRILGPRHAEDAPIVALCAVADLALHFARFPIVDEDLLVTAHTQQVVPVWRESNAVDEVAVVASTGYTVEFEGCTMVEHEVLIIACRRCSQRSLLSYTHGINLRRMSADFPHRISRVCSDAVAVPLFPVAHSYYSLAVAVPCNIVDAA